MFDDDEGFRDRVQSRGERAAADIAQALISSPVFGQALSAAVSAREKAGEAQRAAMGALNVSSQDESDRLERRLRVVSERLEESENRLDRALGQVRELSTQLDELRSSVEPKTKKPAKRSGAEEQG